MRLFRNVVLRPADFRAIYSTTNSQAYIVHFKEWEPTTFRLNVPVCREALTKSMDYDITTCHLSGTLTIIGKKKYDQDLILTGEGKEIELR